MSTPRDTRCPSSRRSGAWFALFVLVCAAATMTYVVSRLSRSNSENVVHTAAGFSESADSDQGRRALEEIRARPHVYYRSARSTEFGRLVVAALDAPNDRRVVTGLSCARVDFGRETGLCLADSRGPLGPSALAQVVDRDFVVHGVVELPGIPIRARLSPDERYAAATVFVTGEHYASDFTTRTTIIDTHTGRSLGDLEQFTTMRDGQPFKRVDFNFWGVTFQADSRRFYATLGTGGTRWLVEGDLEVRQLQVRRENMECPSLSPDQGLIAFKGHRPGTSGWRVHILNAASGAEWPVAMEERSIDDQVEWLDDGHLLYQFVEERGLPEEAMHVWVSSVSPDDRTPPSIFIRAANSPAVVRP